MDTFGKRLRDLRESKNITLKGLAVLLGKDEKNNTTISAWEKDKTQPSIEDIVKLAELLDTTTDYLLKGNPTITNDESGEYVKVRTDELLGLKDELIKYQKKEIEDLRKKEENLKNIEVVRTDT